MNKKITTHFTLILFLIANTLLAKELTGQQAQQKIKGAEKVTTGTKSDIPEYIQFRQESQIDFAKFNTWAHSTFSLSSQYNFKLLNASVDQIGITHYRYRQTFNGMPIEGTMYIVHVKNNKIISMNGMLFSKINIAAAPSINETTALAKSLAYMHADVYRWQLPQMEKLLQMQTNNPLATWYPKGELMLAPEKGNFTEANYRLAYRFDVYAEKPLSRQYVFVDATNGEIIYTVSRIHHTDVPATATTAYSGIRQMTTDSVNATTYRLQETGRGLGLETYNLQQGTNYVNIDFTDTDNNWNNVNAQQDEYATDAHWGAEATYDFYMLNFNRNSVDDAGQKLISYVHYDVNYTNAFWDGTEMTYGDGGGTYTPLTSLDITGHEISHGVTEFSSGLIYANESGALNEAFSDCMGNAIRQYGKQSPVINWLIGDEIGGTPFRNMANPNQYQNPNCYGGQYWNAPNEVHNNSGVMNFWFYLLTEGGSGTNDIGDAYTVTGLGLAAAQAICYRMNAVYLTPNSDYADARAKAIQAAIDLYGACTNEVTQTANAWYAVGVGSIFSPVVTSSFTAPVLSYCSIPASVNFANTSTNAGTFIWDFGDGDTSTANSPTHLYTANGTYTVKLIADGGVCGADTMVQNAYITVNVPSSPIATGDTICPVNTATLTASGSSTLTWYNVPTGGTQLDTGAVFTTPVIGATTTYYVESQIFPAVQFSTPHDSTFGTGTIFTNTNYHQLIFNCYTPVKLVSVKVYAQGAGNRTITLIQNGTVIQTATLNIPNGTSRITLNFDVPVDNNLELGIQGLVDLFRNDAGANFPYTLSGLVSITGTNAGSGGYYYYFYDWELQEYPCISARVPVDATVTAGPVASFTSSALGGVVNFTDASTGATSWLWDFGDPGSGVNNTSTLQNPSHTYAANGTYIVTLMVSDGTCSSTIIQTIQITTVGISDIGNSNQVSVFPNPASEQLVIHFANDGANNKWTLKLVDAIGKVVMEKLIAPNSKGDYICNVATLAPAIYTLILQSDTQKLIKKISKQ